MATAAAPAAGDVGNGGECSSYPPPTACNGSHFDCSVSGVIGECSKQASRAASKGKGRLLRRPRASTEPRAASSSSSALSSSLNGRRRFRVGIQRGEVERRGAGRRDRGDHRVAALALPLGMSIAAVIAQAKVWLDGPGTSLLERAKLSEDREQSPTYMPIISLVSTGFGIIFLSPWRVTFFWSKVLDKQNASGKKISADRLSMICISAVGESIANVFGESFSSFMRNFEGSFSSTLKTLLLINEASIHENISDGKTESEEAPPFVSQVPPTCFDIDSLSGGEESLEADQASNLFNQLIQHGQTNRQLSFATRYTESSGCRVSAFDTFERSVIEQSRSNDLKTFELALDLQRLKLKRSQLALSSDANWLERIKISMGISKASFKEEKLKSQIQETGYAELHKKCIDCLVAGLLIMTSSLLYGTYVYSFERLTEATTSCASSGKVSNSWWAPNPMALLTSGFYTLKCHVLVWSRMLFGLLVILALAFSLLQRSSVTGQAMPITFIFLLLGVACGVVGKLCVDTLGGSGYCWLCYWESLCLLHFFANIYPSVLFRIMNGPVSISQDTSRNRVWVPYCLRRTLFYAVILVLLPLLCGLMPFASPVEWLKHFVSLVAI